MRFDDIRFPENDHERRQWMRFPLPAGEQVTVIVAGQRYYGQIGEVGLGGARIDFNGAMPPPTTMTLSHESSGEFVGDCRWYADGQMGLEFDQSEMSLLLVSHCLKQTVPEPRYSAA